MTPGSSAPRTRSGHDRPGRAARAVAGLGCLAIAWGLWQLVVVAPSATHPIVAVLWLAGALLAHDAVLAPVTVVAGTALVRWVGPRLRRVIAGAALALVSLLLIAAPGWLRP